MKAHANTQSRVPELLSRHQTEILQEWIQQQSSERSARGRLKEGELKEQSRNLLEAITTAARADGIGDLTGSSWDEVRSLLNSICETRAVSGFSPSETYRFVLSLRYPLFAALQRESTDVKQFADEMWTASTMVDHLGVITSEAFLRAREGVITRQQSEMLELSTPVVKLWEGIVGVPLIGTLDSERTQVVMENLLQEVVDTGAAIAIIDITGVPTVDTLVAQHLLKTIAAARLMGADCIISGIRPQIAATIVHLGVDLGNVITKATLADAFALALRRRGMVVKARQAQPGKEDHGTDSNS